MKLLPSLLIPLALALSLSAAQAQPAREDRVAIHYGDPTNPEHNFLRDLLKDQRALERMRDRLSAVRWPRTLKLELKSCGGDPNASYDNAEIVVCYEFLAQFWKAANSRKRPAGISRADALLGPFLDTFFHEAGHAMFDLLKIPVFGSEETAADQMSAYMLLQSPPAEKRGLIVGAAYSYAAEIKVRNARDLYRPRWHVRRQVAYANEHSTPAQRLYNLLCLAYGADKALFADIVQNKYLPKERAEMCADEYQQVDYAYRTLIASHVEAAE
jgi:hypothetical protein